MSAQKPTVFEHEHAGPPSVGASTMIFLVLAGMTAMALMVGFLEIGPLKVWVSLAIAIVQAAIVGVFSMDLKQSDKLTWLVVAASIFWTFLLFLFTLTDFLTRHYFAF